MKVNAQSQRKRLQLFFHSEESAVAGPHNVQRGLGSC